MSPILIQGGLAVVAAGVAIILHELAHGYAALALGDTSAREAGRLSLNPIRHVDRFGTIILPGLLLATQLLMIGRVIFLFGWAKPVPVAAWKFRNPRRGMALVACAGPAMNFFLAWVGAVLMPLPHRVPPNVAPLDMALMQHPYLASFLFYFILTNLVLGLFNLLPIPPLDGGRIAVGVLPLAVARPWARMERAGIAIVLLVVFLLPYILGEFGISFDPFTQALDAILPWAFHILFLLSGHGGAGLVHV